ncbi:MAG: hypothetical protein GDA39_01310, partial [Hyphomonadaceae bacterium]|nr:hypothetical protein [Hyphomonadaceae bacterium]
MPSNVRGNLPSSIDRTVNLGLDLQGGAHMLLEVDLSSVLENQLKNERGAILQSFRDANPRISAEVRVEDDAIVGRFRRLEDVERGMDALRELAVPVDRASLSTARTIRVEQPGEQSFRVTITDENVEFIKNRTIAQSIEVLRKRIDPAGTTEMTLAKEGNDRILLQIPGARDVSEIKERINKTANLSFHMVRPESNSDAAMELAVTEGKVPPGAAYFPEQYGRGLIVEERTKITGACLKSSSEGLHPEGGHPIVNFSFNINCAKLFGNLTTQNIGKRFAVVLDGEIITAPRIVGAITGGSG